MMRFAALMIGWMLCFAAPSIAEEASLETIESKISSARAARTPEADQALQELAIEQAKRNHPISSLKTLGYIRDPRVLAKGMIELRLMSSAGSEQEEANFAGPAKSQAPSGRGALGGASLADFSSLMELIQTTVVPDTWEALGGPSTMSPYPGGIMVDGTGLVSERIEKANDASLDNLAVMLNAERLDPENSVAALDWRQASVYRCVSLKRLAKEIVRRRVSGQPVDDAIRNLAGLSRVQFVVIDQPNQDVVLAGPVGGIESRHGWFRDQKSGLTTLRLEYFTAAAVSILSGEAFGCTIDPTQPSLTAAAETSALIRDQKIPVGLAAEALQKAIGQQDVRVFGTAGDTPLGYLMVEADRHMKQLALGFQPMPKDLPNYLDFITRHIAEGPPNGQLLRLWFTGVPMAVRVDASGQVYEMAGRAMKLDSETKLAGAKGERVAAPADIRVQEFVESFNKNFLDIATEYPVYGALHSVYASAAVAELLRRTDASAWMPSLLGPMLLDDSSEGRLQIPRKVESLATLHRVKHGSKRHSIIVASGGVWIDTRETLTATFRPYPTLSATSERLLGDKPRSTEAASAWWWNTK